MIDTLISLKIIIILVLGTLILDEVFLGLQTAETANFYASRAALVDKNAYEVDAFFNQNILKYFIYTKNNPFIRINDLITIREENSRQFVTKFQITSTLDSRELRNFRRGGYTELSRIQEIKRP